MGSEEWRREQRKRKPRDSLASWADSNGLSARLAGLIADGEATALVVELVKKFRAAHGATLSSAMKASLMAELRGTGRWDTTADKRATPPVSSSGARTGGATRPRSYAAVAAGAAAREAALRAELAALKKAAAVPRQARRKARRVEPADAVPESGPTTAVPEVVGDHADIEVEPTPPQWTCPACTTEWNFIPKRQCHLCKMQRTVIGPAAQAMASVEEDAAVVAKYQGVIDALEALGSASPDDKAIIGGYRAKIAFLRKPKTPAPELPASVRHNAAIVAVEAAQMRNETLLKVEQSIQREIALKQAELQRVGFAVARASKELQEAGAALDAASRLMPSPTAGPAGTHAAPAMAAKATLEATMVDAVEASLGAYEMEDAKRVGLLEYSKKAILEMTLHMQREVGLPPADRPAPAAPLRTATTRAPSAARAPAARTAEGGLGCENRLPERDVKKESLNKTSQAQATAMEACGKTLVKEERERLFNSGRDFDLRGEQPDGEEAAAPSDSGTTGA